MRGFACVAPDNPKTPANGRRIFPESLPFWPPYEPERGDVIERGHPFTRMRERWNPGWGGPVESAHTWRPGAWLFDPYSGCAEAHAMGSVRLHVIDIAAPPGYPRRILYTRRFTDPDGKAMKKSGLLIHTIGMFRQIVKGERLGTYEIVPEAAPLTRYEGVEA